MVLLIAGALVVVLGLFCGVVITLAPLGLVPMVPRDRALGAVPASLHRWLCARGHGW
jgi:hypothetical protein